jgi:integrase
VIVGCGGVSRSNSNRDATPRRVATPKRFLTRDQVQALAEECAPYETLIRVLAYAGLRWASWWH